MSRRPAQVRGTVRAITLRNVNKARGRYTFLVELTLDRSGEGPLTVRVGKVDWERLGAAKRAELAPMPAQTLRVDRYADWAVGERTDLAVELTSPGLAHVVSQGC